MPTILDDVTPCNLPEIRARITKGLSSTVTTRDAPAMADEIEALREERKGIRSDLRRVHASLHKGAEGPTEREASTILLDMIAELSDPS